MSVIFDPLLGKPRLKDVPTFSTAGATVSKSTNYTITTSDAVILCDTSGGSFTVTLPSASSFASRIFYIKKTDTSTNVVTIATTSSQTLDGFNSTSFTLSFASAAMTIVSDGTNWQTLDPNNAILADSAGAKWQVGVNTSGALTTTSLPNASGGFLPSDISGLAVWLKNGTQMNQTPSGTACSANNDPVGEWKDQSGNGNDVTQSTSGSRPTYQTSGQNSKPFARFDGVDDYLIALDSVTTAFTNISIFAVVTFQKSPVNAFQCIVSKDDGTGTQYKWIYGWKIDGTTTYSFHTNLIPSSPHFMDSTSGTPVTGTTYLLEVTKNSTLFSHYINGATNGTATDSQAIPTVTHGLEVGRANTDAGQAQIDLYELIIYNSGLNSTNRQSVESYLNTKFVIY